MKYLIMREQVFGIIDDHWVSKAYLFGEEGSKIGGFEV